MKLLYSILFIALLAGCTTPIAPIKPIKDIKIHWMVPEVGDGSITHILTNDFGLLISTLGLYKIDHKICIEATK